MSHIGLASAPRVRAPALPGRQRGITLIIALIALVALTMAGVALVRSVDTGNVIAGNFAFRQASMQATDTGVETAFTQLQTIANAADTAIANQYYPVMQPLDANGVPTTVTWSSVPSTTLGSNNEYTVRYVIERMCTGTSGVVITDVVTNCVVDQGQVSGSQKSGAPVFSSAGAVNYRVTVRVEGPRNTVAMSQAILAF
jgi:type IV pilus assembly protein PilX